MKKVLIFYAAYGGGHLSAAKSVKEYIEDNYRDVEVSLVDCIKYINKFLDKLTTNAYKEMAKKVPWAWGKVYYRAQKGSIAKISNMTNKLMASKLSKLIYSYHPSFIISTHPFSSQMCGYLKRKGKLNCKIATVLTDFKQHDQWLVESEYMDFYFVAHMDMRKALIEKGIDQSKVYTTGIPISSRFLVKYDRKIILEEFGLEDNLKNILFFGGGEFGLGKSQTLEILETFVKDFDNVQVIAISGRNIKMKEHFENIVKNYGKEDVIKVLEYTNKVPELMSISDIIITKPGGLTTSEALVCRTPYGYYKSYSWTRRRKCGIFGAARSRNLDKKEP